MKVKEKIQLNEKTQSKLINYLNNDAPSIAKTIRAKIEVWDRATRLAEKYNCSFNEITIAALMKACDDENV